EVLPSDKLPEFVTKQSISERRKGDTGPRTRCSNIPVVVERLEAMSPLVFVHAEIGAVLWSLPKRCLCTRTRTRSFSLHTFRGCISASCGSLLAQPALPALRSARP